MSLIDAIDVQPLTTTTTPQPVTIKMVGVFDAEATLALRSRVVSAVTDGPTMILVDLSKVTRITPSAVAGMLEFLRMARAAGGDFRAFGESAALLQAHDALRLTSVIRVYATKSDAIASGF